MCTYVCERLLHVGDSREGSWLSLMASAGAQVAGRSIVSEVFGGRTRSRVFCKSCRKTFVKGVVVRAAGRRTR